jgi:hypothetical protein|uniref:Uncharacterized protein n=1 Tax=Globisporangium ultimum (strain ATCC 200006 / CBS 805.95 / DAOM BR144) TaxID=431595 RepID=K3WNW8_GLOUD
MAQAASDSNFEFVKWLHKNKQDIPVCRLPSGEWTVAEYAVCNGHLEIAKFLYERGYTLSSFSNPIDIVAKEGHLDVI